jgi:nicotinate phosphoribosyltransferase
VEASFAEAVVLETLLLSIYNHDSAIASAASRMTWAAGPRPIIEMGSRRTHESAAVAAARAAYLAGFASTSNLEARRRYGVPSAGTSAHAFTLIHDSERDAFTAQVQALGRSTTLLVDTFELSEAVRTAVEVAGPGLGAVRIDSGDLAQLAVEVRRQLDELGATGTRIIVTSDLDEHAIAALASAPVDGYGVGTSLVTGSGHPTCGFVYKIVARADRSGAMADVAKTSPGKHGIGGAKSAHRLLDSRGTAYAELVRPHGGEPGVPARPLLEVLVTEGEVVGRESLDVARERHASSREELPLTARHLSRGEPAIPTLEREPGRGAGPAADRG